MDAELREDIEAIIETIREARKDKVVLQSEIDELNDEMTELQKQIHQRDDDVEACEDRIELARRQFLDILEDVTQLDEDPADLVRRAFG
jgi:chromosome segregation ATPase